MRFLYTRSLSNRSMVRVAIYIDESGSMANTLGIQGRQMTKMSIAERIWKEAIVPVISKESVRVRSIDSINNNREILPFGSHDEATLANLQFVSNGGTYLWEFLVDEARDFSNDEDWLIILISDGEDNESAAPYNGIEGMNPCINAIRKMGHKPDFHIIGLGLPTAVAASKRRAAGATGGVFFNITSQCDLPSLLTEIRTNLEKNIQPSTREKSIRTNQDAYAATPEGVLGRGPKIAYRDDDDQEIDVSKAVTRFGDGLNSLSDNQLDNWHLWVLRFLGHNVTGNALDGGIRKSWTIPNINKKYWRTLAIDCEMIAAMSPEQRLELLEHVKSLGLKPISSKIFLRGGYNASPDLKIWIMALEALGIKVVRLPKQRPPKPLPNPWIPVDGWGPVDGGGEIDVHDDEWNQIPSDKLAPCRPFLAVYPIVDRGYFEKHLTDNVFENNRGAIRDYPHIYKPNPNRNHQNEGEDDCEVFRRNVDMSHFGIILIETIELLEKCYLDKKITREVWFHIPEQAIHCGALTTGQWDAFLEVAKRIINNGPYPLPMYLNGVIIEL